MSGIGSINTANIDPQRLLAHLASGATSQSEEANESPAQRLQERIGNALQSAGVDQQTADSIQSDLQTALQSLQSSGSKPTHDDIKKAVDAVFSKYGLNAQDILGQRHAHAQPQQETATAPSTAPTSDLTQLIQSLLSGQQQTDPSQLSQSVVAALFGYDVQA
jgi:hypothetical protein